MLLIVGNLASDEPETVRTVQVAILLLCVTLIVALVARRVHLPYTLVLVIVGLLIGLSPLVNGVVLDPNVVLFLFLPALLFEGAWSMDIAKVRADWLPIFLLAVPGLLLNLIVLAVVMHFGTGLPWLLAVLLGAIVAPTDPLASLALFRRLGITERLRTVIEGESLFNDGVGVAVFEVILGLLLPTLGAGSASSAFKSISWLNLDAEVLWLLLGGPALGLAIGWIVAQCLRLVDDHLIEITVTFSVAYGSYLIGSALHTSGLLTVVGAGLVIGSYGRERHMSQRTQEAAQDVWEFIGYLANSLLFLLLGIHIGASNFLNALPGIGWAFLGIVGGRFFAVYLLLPLHDLLARSMLKRAERKKQPEARRRLRFLPAPLPLEKSWRPPIVIAGLRGALSIALVLSLPRGFAFQNLLESIVYGVVLLTLLGQGLGLRFLLPRLRIAEEKD